MYLQCTFFHLNYLREKLKHISTSSTQFFLNCSTYPTVWLHHSVFRHFPITDILLLLQCFKEHLYFPWYVYKCFLRVRQKSSTTEPQGISFIKLTDTATLPPTPLSALSTPVLPTHHRGLGVTKQEIKVSLSLIGGPAQTCCVFEEIKLSELRQSCNWGLLPPKWMNMPMTSCPQKDLVWQNN